MVKPDYELAGTRLITRLRLLAKLARAGRIRLLCAPAGFGKSVLARQFAEQMSPQPMLQLDLHDTDCGVEELCLRFAGVLDLDDVSKSSVEEALKRCEHGLVVLDGYRPEAAADKWLEHLFDSCRPSLQWLVCTRCYPAWNLGKWVLARELTLLEGEELALTEPETKQLLAEFKMTHRVSAADLREQSGGWIAGVCLHLLSLQPGVDRPSGLLHRNLLIQDYLDREVLESLSAEELSLLSTIAHTPFVDDPVCRFLTNDPMALRKLRNRQVFLHRLPGSVDRFALSAPLKQILQERYPDQALPLHATSNWLSQTGAYVEALRYALAIPDPCHGLALVSQISVRDLFVGQNLSYLLEGIDQLGLARIEQNPQALEVVSKALLLGGRLEQAAHTISLLEHQDADVHLALAAELALHQGHAKEAQSLGYKALDGMARKELWPQMILCLSCLTRACLILGDVVAARRLHYQGIELSRRKGEGSFECLLMLNEVLIEELAGNLPRALQVLDQLDQLLVQGPGYALLQGTALMRRGWLLVLTGQERLARDILEEGLLLACATRNPVASHAPTLLAQLDADAGDFAAAEQRLAELQRLMHSWNVSEVLYRGILDVTIARTWLKANNRDSAHRLLSRLRDQYEGEFALTTPSAYPDLYAPLGFLQAEILCSQGARGEAIKLLEQVIDRARHDSFNTVLCQAQLILSDLVRQEGEILKAERLESAAQAMALRQGQRSLLLSNQSDVIESGLQLEHVEQTKTPEAELLSRRELVVLGLIAKGYSNYEIAKILSLSPFTVKTHAKNINSKLNVHSRMMAVARAKALGLLL